MSIKVDLNITLTCDKCGNTDHKYFGVNYGDIRSRIEDAIDYYEYKYINYELLCLDCQEKVNANKK